MLREKKQLVKYGKNYRNISAGCTLVAVHRSLSSFQALEKINIV